MKSMRPTLYGNRHAVSAGHYLAAAAGFAILEAGGNAIDAGCATGIALAVLHPDEVNVAGVAPIMIRTGPHGEKGGKVVTIAGLGHWPKRFPADLFMREHGGKMPLGILRTVVPAAPDASTMRSAWASIGPWHHGPQVKTSKSRQRTLTGSS